VGGWELRGSGMGGVCGSSGEQQRHWSRRIGAGVAAPVSYLLYLPACLPACLPARPSWECVCVCDVLQVKTHLGTFVADVPSGASTGAHEACEMRDGGRSGAGEACVRVCVLVWMF
jgi:hypothetical protein